MGVYSFHTDLRPLYSALKYIGKAMMGASIVAITLPMSDMMIPLMSRWRAMNEIIRSTSKVMSRGATLSITGAH